MSSPPTQKRPTRARPGHTTNTTQSDSQTSELGERYPPAEHLSRSPRRQVRPLAYLKRPGARTLILLFGCVAVLALLAVSVRSLGADTKPARVYDVADGEIVRFPPSPTASSAPGAELAITAMVNDYREQRGLPRLVSVRSLWSVARAHSREMYDEGYFGHVSPAGETFSDRLRAGGISYTAAAETLALAPIAAEAFQQFLDSPNHRERLIDPQYCDIGVGAYRGPEGLIVTMVLAVDRPYGWPPSEGCFAGTAGPSKTLSAP